MGTEQEQALHWAAELGQIEEVRALLSEGVDKDCVGGWRAQTPLCEAAVNGHVDVAQLLIAAGADINKGDINGRTPMHWAAVRGHEKVAQLLIKAGADINKEDNWERTPLHWAVQWDINGTSYLQEIMPSFF